jgi:hypothetical protein
MRQKHGAHYRRPLKRAYEGSFKSTMNTTSTSTSRDSTPTPNPLLLDATKATKRRRTSEGASLRKKKSATMAPQDDDIIMDKVTGDEGKAPVPVIPDMMGYGIWDPTAMMQILYVLRIRAGRTVVAIPIEPGAIFVLADKAHIESNFTAAASQPGTNIRRTDYTWGSVWESDSEDEILAIPYTDAQTKRGLTYLIGYLSHFWLMAIERDGVLASLVWHVDAPNMTKELHDAISKAMPGTYGYLARM